MRSSGCASSITSSSRISASYEASEIDGASFTKYSNARAVDPLDELGVPVAGLDRRVRAVGGRAAARLLLLRH